MNTTKYKWLIEASHREAGRERESTFRPIPFGFSASTDIKRFRTSLVLSSEVAEGALARRFVPLDILLGVTFSILLMSSLFKSKGFMTSLLASDPTGNEGMLAPGSGDGAGEVEKFPLGVLLDNFTLETDLVGAITAAGADQ
jgi:hypothetical protein